MKHSGRSTPHDSAAVCVTGQAQFIDDLPRRDRELYVGAVTSPVAAGILKSVDLEPARGIPGVVDLFTADAIPGETHFGVVWHDEPFLAIEEVLYVGQPIAVVAAESRETLEAACRAVRLEIEPRPPILSIDEAQRLGRFLGPSRAIRRGNPAEELARSVHRLAGCFHTGSQEHFYFEPQSVIAIPEDQQRMVLTASTQNPSEIQAHVARMLGWGLHQVVCVAPRMGGGFGGKETQAAIPSLMAALVAHRTGRAARVVYSRQEDMRQTGKRHAYQTRWQVGFDDRGLIQALRLDYASDGGAAADLSIAILERSTLHAENAYFIPHIEIAGRVCFTNLPPSTAFRGFGAPQAIAAIENVIEQIALHRGLDPLEVRRRNLYSDAPRNETPYGQVVAGNHLPVLVDRLARSSGYGERRAAIRRFNATSPVEVRGISLVPVKFGISFVTSHLNQANALVNVYTDGTIQVSTGGTEMGQGLKTKIQQLVADAFGVDVSAVRVMPTSTEKNNNTSPTAASASADLNGAAALDACRQILRRLRPIAAAILAEGAIPKPSGANRIRWGNGLVWDARQPERRIFFAQVVERAHRSRIDLGARGFYATPDVHFDPEAGRGTPFAYFTQGAAVAEVSLDRLTGELRVLRVDILMDIGRSINPGIDRGQIVGGFVQGQGWVTTEQVRYSESGQLLSDSATTYKIPAATDVAPCLDVEFFDAAGPARNIHRSKAVGEPPFVLGLAVWTAVRECLASLDPQAADSLSLPATGEEILRCLNSRPETEPVSAPQTADRTPGC